MKTVSFQIQLLCTRLTLVTMSITVNISRQLERPALNLFRHCSTSVKKGLDNANKDDYIRQPFALKLKAETIHHVLGIIILHREHQSILVYLYP